METFKKMGQEIIVVTTFHPEGMEVYGQRFIDSFAQNVAKAIKLVVYAEDCNPVNPDPNQITILDAKQELLKLNALPVVVKLLSGVTDLCRLLVSPKNMLP